MFRISRLVQAALVVMTTSLGSALLGFVREVINARFYGTHWELDTFLAAAAIPTVLFGVFNGALVSALVPVFSGFIAEGREYEAWSLASTVFNILFVVLSVCAVIGYFAAPWYVPVIAHGFPAPQMGIAIRMTRWLMPSIVTTSLAGVASAMLNAHHRFSSAALQGMAINLVTIGTVLALNGKIGIYALTLGTTLGLIAQLFVQVPELLRLGKYRLRIDLHHPGLSRIWQLLGPIIIGSAAGQIALCFDRFFASMLPPGSISGMNYAIRVVGVPLQLFAAAVATVIFPLLAAQFAGNNHCAIKKSIKAGMGAVNLITIPAVGLLIVLAHPIVATLFQGGAFDQKATDFCATLLPFAALGLVPQAATMVLSRCCFAGRESRMTAAASVVAVVVNVLLSMLLLPRLGASGLLLANATGQWIQALALLFLVRRLVDGMQMRNILMPALRISGVTLFMSCALYAFERSGLLPARLGWDRLPLLLGECIAGIVIFYVVARLLRVEEISMFNDAFERKLKNLEAKAPPELPAASTL